MAAGGLAKVVASHTPFLVEGMTFQRRFYDKLRRNLIIK